MTDPKNPLDELMKMGQGWAEAMGQSAQAFSPEAMEKIWPTMPKEAMEAFMGKGLNPEGLDAKTRILLTLQGLIIQGALSEMQIRMTIRHAIEAGATSQELNETIALAGLFGGAAAMPKALLLLTSVQEESK